MFMHTWILRVFHHPSLWRRFAHVVLLRSPEGFLSQKMRL